MAVARGFFFHKRLQGFKVRQLQALQMLRRYVTTVTIYQVNIYRQCIFPLH